MRESWVVFHHGATIRDGFTEPVTGPELVATWGSQPAGGRGRGQDRRAATAIALYEHHGEHRPPGWPAAGTGALCVLAAQGRARTLEGDIALLLILARDMRACALLDDDEHRRRCAARAAKRATPRATPIAFRSTLPPRFETNEQRRRRLRDQLLLQGENPADWTIATALAHRLGLKVAADLVDAQHSEELTGELAGFRDRVARYREELRSGRWQLPSGFFPTPPPRA